MEIHLKTEVQLQLLESLIAPRIPISGNLKRATAAPTKIKSLYHLYQLQKNVKNGKWTNVFQGKTRISKDAKVSKNHFSKFVNSPDFLLFGSVIHRPGTSNIYHLNPWVLEMFSFFEKKGMMKKFRENFNDWKKVFVKRLNNWLLPLVRKGLTLSQILMNKLSTKSKLKGVDLNTLKGVGIKYTSTSYKSFQGSRSNTEQPLPLAAQNMCEVNRLLKDRFHIRDGDIYMLSNSFSLNHHKRAIKLGISWLKKGMLPTSPVRMYQTCLNRTRIQK